MLTKESVLGRLIEMLEHPENIKRSFLKELTDQVSVADTTAPEGATTVLIPKLCIDR
jgi:hypothetical protein